MIINNTEISVLKAGNGDSIYIETTDRNGALFNVLIDGGTASAYPFGLMKRLANVDKINLLVLTHIDSDHIAGLILFLKSRLSVNLEVDRYWINCPNLIMLSTGNKISYNQGLKLERFLSSKEVNLDKVEEMIFTGERIEVSKGIFFTVLSPTKDILDEFEKNWPVIVDELEKERIEKNNKVKVSNGSNPSQLDKGKMKELAKLKFAPDKNISDDLANASSISFVFECLDCSVLFLGDSRAEVIYQSLINLGYTESNKLKVEYVKVSHHGSMNNTSNELLDLLDCDNYIISTNGGSKKNKHPDRELISRIIYHPERDFERKRTILFNYPISKITEKSGEFYNEDDLKDGNWTIKEL